MLDSGIVNPLHDIPPVWMDLIKRAEDDISLIQLKSNECFAKILILKFLLCNCSEGFACMSYATSYGELRER